MPSQQWKKAQGSRNQSWWTLGTGEWDEIELYLVSGRSGPVWDYPYTLKKGLALCTPLGDVSYA